MIYYIKSSLWQLTHVIQPIEAESEESAIDLFTKTLLSTGQVRDVDIEEVITNEHRLKEVLDEVEDEQETIH